MTPGNSEQITVVIVDDHTMFSAGLTRLLDDECDIVVVGSATTVAEGWTVIDQHHPTVALLDYYLPDGTGVDLTTQIKSKFPDIHIVLLTGTSEERIMLRAIEAGCSGFVTKDRAYSEVADAVRAAARGEAVISPAMLRRLLPKLTRGTHALGDDLTKREREVLSLLAAGLANRAIAKQMFLSVNTIRNYVSSILAKLHCHSKLEAVSIGVRSGIIDFPSPETTTAPRPALLGTRGAFQ